MTKNDVFDKITAVLMTTPDLRQFLGWDKPAIELVAERLEELHHQNPDTFRRATVVVPTSESGRRLREYMAERAGKPILMPRIILTSQLIPTKGENVASDMEALAVWLQVLGADGADPVAQYAPLIPRRPETHRERWAVGVAHKLMALRTRLEQEEVGIDDVTGLLCKREHAVQAELDKLGPKEESARKSLLARKAVFANEQVRWRRLGELFNRVDALLKGNTITKLQADWLENPALRGQSKLLIMACVPEFSPQIKTCLRQLSRKAGVKVEIWVHAPEEEAAHFDAFGLPLEESWCSREIDIPDALVFSDPERKVVDNARSTIHLTDDAESMAAEAVRLAGGFRSDEVVLATGSTDFSPSLLNAFSSPEIGMGWQMNAPEGRSLRTTELGSLPEQLADFCAARNGDGIVSDKQGGMLELNAFVALLCNRALQQVLYADAEVLANLQSHVEQLRAVLLPASVQSLCDLLNPKLELPVQAYRSLQNVAAERNVTYWEFARRVRDFAVECCQLQLLPDKLKVLVQRVTEIYADSALKAFADKFGKSIHDLLDKKMPGIIRNPAMLLEILRHEVRNMEGGQSNSEAFVGNVMGWRELTFTKGKRIIVCAMHDGCIPEPVEDDEFLPESLCRELHIKHEPFRIARDSYLLTALLKCYPSGAVHLVTARQNPDGSSAAPSGLLLRCGSQLPYRARAFFAESSGVSAFPPVPLYALRTSQSPEPKDGKLQPGEMESIEQIAPGKTNPFLRSSRAYSPSSLELFLQCPFTFWLKHLYQLDAGEVYDDEKSELENNEYGTLVHAVLESAVKLYPTEEKLRAAFPDAISVNELTAALNQKMIAIVRSEWERVYLLDTERGVQPLPMEVLMRNVEGSMEAFARQHVEDLLLGWENVACEYTLKPSLTLSNGETVKFKMVADRIDRHRNGHWRIIDYKTSADDKKPLKVHFELLEEGEESPYYRFMNASGYRFPLAEAAFKNNTVVRRYRWKNVQLMLYAYGLRQLNATDIRNDLKSESLAGVMPDLLYYNLQSNNRSMPCYPLLQSGRLEQFNVRNSKGTFRHTPEELLEYAMVTVDSAIRMIRDGKCLFSAESLKLKTRPFSRLTGDTWDKNAPRFGAVSPTADPRSMFNLPELNV